MHSSIFPVVRFAFRRFVLLRWSFLPFFLVWGLNISGLDRVLPSGLGLLPVDRLSSFVSFGLRLILQRLTEGPKRPRVCCSPTPLHFGPKPTKTCSIISIVRSRSRGRKPHLIWTLLAPSTYKYVHPVKIRDRNPSVFLLVPSDMSDRAGHVQPPRRPGQSRLFKAGGQGRAARLGRGSLYLRRGGNQAHTTSLFGMKCFIFSNGSAAEGF